MRLLNFRYEGQPPGSVMIDRGTPLGNPFCRGTRKQNIARYKELFEQDKDMQAYLLSLGDVDLVCHCVPLQCHGQVLIDWLADRALA